jgi:pSer/pThr/pTyr-binding forkhead associated (FHA) protein
MSPECPNCKTPLPSQESRFCNQCGFDLHHETEGEDQLTPDDVFDTHSVEAPAVGPSASLRIVLRDGGVIERQLVKAETTIGKGALNDITLADPAVSTAHAAIRFEREGYTIVDLGSRNGTLVNDAKIEAPRVLAHGDVIRMGRCSLTFRLSQATETAVLQPAAIAAIVQATPVRVTQDALANAVVAAGLTDEATMKGLRSRLPTGGGLVKALIDELKINDVALRDLISSKFSIPMVDVSQAKLDQGIAAGLSPVVLRDNLAFPAAGRPSFVTLVVADPTDEETIKKVKQTAKGTVELRISSAGEIRSALDALYAPRLVGLLPSGEKFEALINAPEVEIGKASHNHIVLTQPTVSNTHAVILARAGGYSIVDLGSSNGTFVNGERLGDEARTLQHGDKIQVAEALLTFRNPAETTEHKTARLTPDVLEEVRRRAGLGLPISTTAERAKAGHPTLPSGSLDGDKEEKKKKKKKSDDTRMRATLISSASRLIAQVLGGVVTVGLTIYLLSPNKGGSVPEKNPPNVNSKFAEPGTFASFQGGPYEASGVSWVQDTNKLLIVNDGKPGEILMMTINEYGRQEGPMASLPLNAPIIDPEDIASDGHWFYIIGSQSDPKDGALNSLVRFAFDPATSTIRGTPEAIPDFRSLLLSQVPDLAREGNKPGKEGGLNIEALTFDPISNRLLFGLRSPVIRGRAMIIPMRLKDPLGALSADNVQFSTPRTIALDLGGQGIRGIDYNPKLKIFTILSGATELEKKTDFGFWEWGGETDQSKPENAPRRFFTLDEDAKPEGMTNVTIKGKEFVMIVGDASKYLKLDYASR